MSMTTATPDIVESDRRTVTFGTGGTMVFDWNCAAPCACELSLKVSGNGTLTVTREGADPIVYTTGEYVYAFKKTEAGMEPFTLTLFLVS